LIAQVLIALAFTYGVLAFVGYFFLGGFLYGAGFQPTPRRDIDLAGRLVGLKQGMVVYDLGSGIGTVVFYLAKTFNVRCVGIEVDPLKFWISNFRVKSKPALKDKVGFFKGNLLDVDISKADVIYVFLSGGSGIMEKLKKKILSEAKPEAKIVSYAHLFKGWDPIARSGDVRVYTVARRTADSQDAKPSGRT
jgi:predicted RNA methylase